MCSLSVLIALTNHRTNRRTKKLLPQTITSCLNSFLEGETDPLTLDEEHCIVTASTFRKCSSPNTLEAICTRTYSMESNLPSHQGTLDTDAELILILKTQKCSPSGERHAGRSMSHKDVPEVCRILQRMSDIHVLNNRQGLL